MPETNWLAFDPKIESELRNHLGPVTAPPELWAKIQSPQRVSPFSARQLIWPAIAILLLLASADLLWEFSKARGGFRQFARPTPAELASISGQDCDLWSNDPGRILHWIKSQSGIELEIPPHSTAKMIGARVENLRGTPVASIAYESGNRRGSLLVWKAGRQHAKHGLPVKTDNLVSWSQGENVFAVSAANETIARGACMLCHPEGTHGI